MQNLKTLAAVTALNVMMQKNYFSICAIDSVAKMLGVNPKSEAYDILLTLHCVDWDKMPKELKDAVPELIKECLGIVLTYQLKPLEMPELPKEVKEEIKLYQFLKLLGLK